MRARVGPAVSAWWWDMLTLMVLRPATSVCLLLCCLGQADGTEPWFVLQVSSSGSHSSCQMNSSSILAAAATAAATLTPLAAGLHISTL